MPFPYGEEKGRDWRVDVEILTGCALVGLAVFPLIGNAVTLFVQVPRRVVQTIVVIVFAGFAAYGLSRLYDARMLFRGGMGRRFAYAALPSMGLIAALALAGTASGTRPSGYAVFAAMVVPLWLSLAILNLIGWNAIRESTERFGLLQGFNRFVFTLLAALALAAYFKGPEKGDVLMAFGGSTTVAGTNAAILGGVALTTLSGWYRPAGLLLAMYLSFLASSRAGLLLFVVLSVAILLVRSTDLQEGWERGRDLCQDLLLLVLCAVIVVLPARFSILYPYFASRPGEAGIRVANRDTMLTQWEAFEWRYGRLLALIKTEGQAIDSGPTQNSSTAVPGVLEGLRTVDSRWELLLDTLKVVAANPRGYWPRSFGEVAHIWCARPIRDVAPVCAYPHNLLLEIGFYFGWIPFVLLAAGLLVWSIRVLKTLSHHAVPVRVAAVAFLAYLLFAQVSGDLRDHLVAAGFGMFWMATQVLPRRQLGENSGTVALKVGEDPA